jgi:pimeloyl-ACP methyl ester carboxylesterase
MPWVELAGDDIYFIEAGEGEPLVFLHGMSSCSEAWWQQFEYFSKHYHVYAYDSVNHGHSSNSPRDQQEPDRTDELEAFLQALGIEKPILAGNSMGAATILRWACRHPKDAQALIISGMGVAEADHSMTLELSPLSEETLFLPVGDALTTKLRSERPLMYERYLRIRSTATRLEYMRHPRPRNSQTIEETAGLYQSVPSIQSPMLVIVGSVDRLVPNAQRLHKLVSGSHYVEIDGAPHNVYWEAADPWNRIVTGFLQEEH